MPTRLKKSFRQNSEVWVVGFVAILIYLPGIWWGLPHATHPLGVHGWDIDAVTGMQTLSELHNLFIQPKPDWYLAYPPFHYLLIGFVYSPYLAFLFLTGQFSQPSPQYPFGLADPVSVLRNLALIGRAVSLLMASGIVVSAYLTARTVWDIQTARLTALAVALPTTMVFYARTGNLDIPVLFWMSLTILVLARCFISGFTVRRAIWLGIFAALAVATKDQAYGALTVGLLMLVIIHLWRGTPNSESVARWKAPLALFISGLTVFICVGGLLISPNRFFGHLEFVRNFDKTFDVVIRLNLLYPPTLEGYFALSSDVFSELFTAVGPILLIIGLIGFCVIWRSTIFGKVLILMFLGHLILVIFPIRHMAYRYTMFLTFVLAFFIARAIVLGLQQQKWIKIGAFVILISGFGWMGLRAVDLTYQMIFDARYQAGDWLQQNTNPEDKLAYFNAGSTVQLKFKPQEKENRVVWLMDDPSPLERLQKDKIRFILAQPDFSSKVGDDRSLFFPEAISQKLNDGSLGYRKVASFETKPLFHGFFLDLPLLSPGYIVNTPIKIYDLGADKSS